MDYLNCPNCNDAPLMKNGNVRQCENCGNELNEIEYTILAAKRQDEFNRVYDSMTQKPTKQERLKFGRNQIR